MNKETLPLIENIFKNKDKYSESQQLNTLLDLYNIEFVNNNNFHTELREMYVGKDFDALNIIEKEVFGLVRLTENMYEKTSSEKVLEIANKLFVEKKEGLFPSFVSYYVSSTNSNLSIKEQTDKCLNGLLSNEKINIGYAVKCIIANTLKPGYPELARVKLSNYAPDEIHFELEDLNDKIDRERGLQSNLSPEEWAGLFKVDKFKNQKNEDNDTSEIKDEYNFSFERFKTGKPKYNLLSPIDKVYASIIVGDLKVLQATLYNKDFLKEINLNSNGNLAFKLADRLVDSENSEKIKTFLNDFLQTDIYKKHHKDDSGIVRKPKPRCPPKSLLKDKYGVKYDKIGYQKDWDLLLLNEYNENPTTDILSLYNDFLTTHNLDKLSATRKDGTNTSYYKRVPNFALTGEFTVKDFVENNLPETYKIILEGLPKNETLSKIYESKEEGKRIQHPVESSFGVTYTRKEVQKVWDEKLIDTFFSKSGKMKEHFKMFLLELGITEEKFKESGLLIHRLPLLWKEEHREVTTNFFVSNYIPRLGNLLRKYEDSIKENKENILQTIPKMKLRTSTTIGDGNFVSDMKELKEARKEFRKAIAERNAYSDFKERSNGWSKLRK